MKTSRLFSKPILLAFLGLLSAANASANILISENFSSGYTDGDITTQTATGTGLTGSWAKAVTSGVGGTGITGATFTSTGLSFGTFATSGGAMTVTVSSGTATSSNIIVGANTATFGTFTGKLYTSYLYQVSPGYTDTLHSIGQRIGSSITSNAAASRFSLNPDNVATGTYAATAYSSSVTTGSGITPAVSTTYFTVGSFTNVGTAGGGTASMVTLDLDQYNDWITDGGTEALLFARIQGTDPQQARVNTSHTSTTQANFIAGTSTFLQLSMNLGANIGAFSTTFDEFKYATTFGEVVPFASVVPVPVLNIQADGNDLVFTWSSTAGYTYALLSDDDLDPAPSLWPVVGTNTGIVATPPLNTLTIPRPALSRNFYTLEVTAP